LTDGILILRYLFDPRGPWQFEDALDIAATRTSREAIRSYLDNASAGVLDVDGNGRPDALTDGILILRYLFDPGGPWDYTDALGSGATRTTRSAIKAYLDLYNPAQVGPPAWTMDSQESTLITPPVGESEPQTAGIFQVAVNPARPICSSAELQSQTDVRTDTTINDAEANACVLTGMANVVGRLTNLAAATRETRARLTSRGVLPVLPADRGVKRPKLDALDAVLYCWDRCESGWTSSSGLVGLGTFAEDKESLDELWGDGGLDWLLIAMSDSIHGLEASEITLAL